MPYSCSNVLYLPLVSVKKTKIGRTFDSEEGHFLPLVAGVKLLPNAIFLHFSFKKSLKPLIFEAYIFRALRVRIIYITQSDCASCTVSFSGLKIRNSLLYSGRLQIRQNLMRIIAGTGVIDNLPSRDFIFTKPFLIAPKELNLKITFFSCVSSLISNFC